MPRARPARRDECGREKERGLAKPYIEKKAEKGPLIGRQSAGAILPTARASFLKTFHKNAPPSDGGMPERCMQLCTARWDSELRSDIVLGPAVSPSFRAARIFTSDEQTTYGT